MEMTISTERAAARPKRDLLASAVLEKSREFFLDPENEKAFLEWKAERENEKKGA